MKYKKTNRGFVLTEFVDRYGAKCSLQESSLAEEAAIWFGADELGLKGFIPFEGWEDISESDLKEKFEVQDIVANTRMHLTQDMVKELLPALIHFAETGYLPHNEEFEASD